jgi:mRNA interferase MazF
MTGFSFGDIILVPFLFTDQSASKKRPAVVVSSSAYNSQRPDVVIMAVTSQKRSTAHYGDVTIQHWQKAGLLNPSVIKPVFATIEKRLVLRTLGILSETDQSSLIHAIRSILCK